MYSGSVFTSFFASFLVTFSSVSGMACRHWLESRLIQNVARGESRVYSPQCNSGIEGFHKFLKATIGKQLQGGLEWDSLVWKATTAYNSLPTQSSKYAPFFLMFGREAVVKHMLLASESPKYLGMDEGILNVKLLQKLFHIVGYNLAKSRTARDGTTTNNRKPHYIKVGANV